MTRIYALIFAATLLLSAAGCAGPYAACVKPYTNQVTWAGTVTELGEVVGAFLACDPSFSGGAAPLCAVTSLETLEGTLGPDGRAIVDCLVSFWETHGAGAQRAAAHAVAVKRGIHAGLMCPQLIRVAHGAQGEPATALRSAHETRGSELLANERSGAGPLAAVREGSAPAAGPKPVQFYAVAR